MEVEWLWRFLGDFWATPSANDCFEGHTLTEGGPCPVDWLAIFTFVRVGPSLGWIWVLCQLIVCFLCMFPVLFLPDVSCTASTDTNWIAWCSSECKFNVRQINTLVMASPSSHRLTNHCYSWRHPFLGRCQISSSVMHWSPWQPLRNSPAQQ